LDETEYRVAIVEKLLKFTNVTREEKSWNNFENQVRFMVDNSVNPT
jgi:hypothetical protein